MTLIIASEILISALQWQVMVITILNKHILLLDYEKYGHDGIIFS
jgi:hypothetical protein